MFGDEQKVISWWRKKMSAVEASPATHSHFFAFALVKVFILEAASWGSSSPTRLELY
jgi:hypothetical protein